jgi:argininosuccinate lyase
MSVAFSRVYVEHVLDPGYRNLRRLYYGDLLAVHKAHLIMLEETGTVSRTAAAAINASMAGMGTILQRARAGESKLTILSTHGQPANVSTIARYLSAFLLDFLEGTESLVTAMGSTDHCPLGACAITGTGLAIDRDRTSLFSRTDMDAA